MAARLSPSPPRQYKADRDLAKMGDDFIFFAGLIGVESWTVLTPALFHSERRLRFFPIYLGLDRLANFRFSVRFGFQFSVTVRFGLLTENYFRFSDNELRFSVNRQP